MRTARNLRTVASLAVAAVVAAVFVIFVVPTGSDDGLPDPPREDTRVFTGSDRWHLALPDSPVAPNRPSEIWVKSDEFDDSEALLLSVTPKGEGGPWQTFNISTYLGDPGDEWRQLVPSIHDFRFPVVYDVQLIRRSDEKVLVQGEWPHDIAGWIDGIRIQEWTAVSQALRAVRELDNGTSLTQASCSANPYDEITGQWTVTCQRAGAETMWLVDAQSGETTQVGEPTLPPAD